MRFEILAMRKLSLLTAFIFTSFFGFSQQLVNPNFALASHPMKVTKISHTTNETIIELSIENQIDAGSFCADRNIFAQDVVSGQKHYLIKSEGIPVCPQSYQFTSIGEVLNFKLYFPKIATKKYLTLVEDCNQYCFSIKGIVLDADMNQSINLGYTYYQKGKLDFALEAFKMAVNKHPDYPFGLHYLNIVQIYAEKNDFVQAKNWYKKIVDSNFQDKKELIERLKKQSYYSKLL
jgi:tetratricopeptide (TPR) repeat protein